MPRHTEAPPIDRRKASDLYERLRSMVPHYVPEWPAEKEGDPGLALIDAFSVIAEGVIQQLNRAPEKNFIEFLNMLGLRLLPARPASAYVQFRVNPGLEAPVLVTAGAQCSAPPAGERTDDLPFETTSNLWAVPSTLAALVGVDPFSDAIFKPPPKFLELERAAQPVPAYRTASFSAAGSRTIQLDRTEELDEGDSLRISAATGQISPIGVECHFRVGDSSASGAFLYLSVAAKPEGRIVGLEDPLPYDVRANTPVHKVTDFNVFDAYNLQKHILYLGHSDLFTIENAAEIDIDIAHLAGSAANIGGLDLVWEYGVKAEAGGYEWLEFEIQADSSAGFSRDGVVRLFKPAGEIAEEEVDGKTSRWIRVCVRDPIPAVPRPLLPRLNGVTLHVASPPGEVILPDQNFHNDTPLQLPDIQPFGPEPRQFDRFYIASEEVFSKKNADITLDIKLESGGGVGTPAAASFNGILYAFARGSSGRLISAEIVTGAEPSVDVVTHEALERGVEIASGSAPSVITTAGDRLMVFVRGDDGNLYMRLYDPGPPENWSWNELGKPDSVKGLVYDPAAVWSNEPQVFVVGSNGELYSTVVDEATGAPGNWTSHKTPEGRIDSSPTAVAEGADLRVYASDSNGVIHELAGVGEDWSAVLPDDVVVALDPRRQESADREDLPRRSRLFAQLNPGSLVTLAVRDTSNHLVELRGGPNSDNPPVVTWADRDLNVDLDPPRPTVTSAPTGVIFEVGDDDFERRHLFVRDADNRLWEATADAWLEYDRPGGADVPLDLHLTPSATVHKSAQGVPETLCVFAATKANLLVELRQNFRAPTRGPAGTLILSPTASGNDKEYNDKSVTVEKGGEQSDIRHIAAYGGSDRAIRLKDTSDPWEPLPDSTYTYRILELVAAGNTDAEISRDEDDLGLESGDGVEAGMIVRIATGATAQVRVLDNDPDADGNAKVTKPWNLSAPSGTPYEVFSVVTDDAVSSDSAKAIPLDTASSSDNGQYVGEGLRIEFDPASGNAPEDRTVDSYSGEAQVALLDTAPSEPAKVTGYSFKSIFKPAILDPVAWLTFRNPLDQDINPALSWEYWNGDGWVRLQVRDETNHFLNNGVVRFRIPSDLEQTEVSGQESVWIRARLVGGDYGRETFKSVTKEEQDPVTNKNVEVTTVIPVKEGIDPPLIKALTIGYELREHVDPQHCVTYNNLSYVDQTAACVTAGKHFEPFEVLEDEHLAVYLGFDKLLESGPIRVLFVAEELPVEATERPKMAWTFRSENEWKDLNADDDTEGLVRQELLTLQVPEGFQPQSLFGDSRYWVRGSLATGQYLDGRRPLLRGVFPNTVETVQAATVTNEILGSSNGEADQEFPFLVASEAESRSDWSIIGKPEIRVREVLSLEEVEAMTAEFGQNAIEDLEVLGEKQTWVLWTEVDHFFKSSSSSRHYRLDRAQGRISFGDGRRGMIPPAGTDNIQAFYYREGGGSKGNVGAGEINGLVTAVAGVDSVLNPVEAGGGSDVAPLEEMLRMGPAQISNRSRAVTPEDFEWLAREASREVVRARCRPNFKAGTGLDPDNEGLSSAGWVTVYIAPRSREDQPRPSLALQRKVERYLKEASESSLSEGNRIAVRAPSYVPITVEADVFAVSLDRVADVEGKVKKELRTFLHPLKGAPKGAGWDFGRPVAASDVFVLLEAIDGVDHVENLQLHHKSRTSRELARIGPDELIAWAEPRIHMKVV